MLSDHAAMATIAVRDMAAARRFYGDTLKLEPAGEMSDDVTTYRSGDSTLVVYVSEFAATNRATSATWGVGDEFDDIVRTLRDAGVPFEHYEMPEGRLEGDVHVFGDFKAAWFTDPDGNILHVNNG
ncbi:MAG: VOC family protein [Longimicrobiales bacterium]